MKAAYYHPQSILKVLFEDLKGELKVGRVPRRPVTIKGYEEDLKGELKEFSYYINFNVLVGFITRISKEN